MLESGETAAADPVARRESMRSVRATAWPEGRGPRPFDLDGDSLTDGIAWFDVGRLADPASVLESLKPFCDGLELEMLEDLLEPDGLPENGRWHGGSVRLASTFAVYPAAKGKADWVGRVEPSPEVVYQKVELLAGADWLITTWHDARCYCGKDPTDDIRPPIGQAEVFDGVAKKWCSTSGGNAGDLGVLVMRELALTYAPAHRHFRVALEAWELRLYGQVGEMGAAVVDPERERELLQLWYARAKLRDWLSPLNVLGVNEDLDRAWLPAKHHEPVKALDLRIDKNLAALETLGNTLRDSFHLLYIKASEAQRERQESAHRHLELMAIVLLVPTLIVGFYGANTWLPGDHRHWGFLVMIAALAIFTTAGVLFVRRYGSHRSARVAWRPVEERDSPD